MNQRETARSLRRSIGMLLLLILSSLSCGCSLTRETHRVFDLAKRTVHVEPHFYEYIKSDRLAQREARLLAEQAWGEIAASVPNASRDFENGYVEGFADYLYRGGTGAPPVIPPRGYWHLRFLNHFGKATINEWYEGFRQGAENCKARGLREMWLVPTSLISEEDDKNRPHVPTTQEHMWSAETEMLDPDSLEEMESKRVDTSVVPPEPADRDDDASDEPGSSQNASPDLNDDDVAEKTQEEVAADAAGAPDPFLDDPEESDVSELEMVEREPPAKPTPLPEPSVNEEQSDATIFDDSDTDDIFNLDAAPVPNDTINDPVEDVDNLFDLPETNLDVEFPDTNDLETIELSDDQPLSFRSSPARSEKIPAALATQQGANIRQTSGELELAPPQKQLPILAPPRSTKPGATDPPEPQHIGLIPKPTIPSPILTPPQKQTEAKPKPTSQPKGRFAVDPITLTFDDPIPPLPMMIVEDLTLDEQEIDWNPAADFNEAAGYTPPNLSHLINDKEIEATTKWTAEMSRAMQLPLKVADARGNVTGSKKRDRLKPSASQKSGKRFQVQTTQRPDTPQSVGRS